VRTKAKQSQSEDATVQMPEEPERPEKPMELIKPPRMNGECACVWFSRGQRLRVALHQGLKRFSDSLCLGFFASRTKRKLTSHGKRMPKKNSPIAEVNFKCTFLN